MYAEDIKKLTKENTAFRRVLHTGKNAQIVAMSLPVGVDIGEEVHQTTDQLVFIIEGRGEAILNGESRDLGEHNVVFVPAGTRHNFKNTGDRDLKLFTIYAPPEHPDGTVHKKKEDAEKEKYE